MQAIQSDGRRQKDDIHYSVSPTVGPLVSCDCIAVNVAWESAMEYDLVLALVVVTFIIIVVLTIMPSANLRDR